LTEAKGGETRISKGWTQRLLRLNPSPDRNNALLAWQSHNLYFGSQTIKAEFLSQIFNMLARAVDHKRIAEPGDESIHNNLTLRGEERAKARLALSETGNRYCQEIVEKTGRIWTGDTNKTSIRQVRYRHNATLFINGMIH
jgi:hypothetical protein